MKLYFQILLQHFLTTATTVVVEVVGYPPHLDTLTFSIQFYFNGKKDRYQVILLIYKKERDE